jgi:uncharacterized membrane protein
MAGPDVFCYVGVYGSVAEAEEDYEEVRALHHGRVLGSCDVAILARDAAGHVKVHKHEKPTQRGAWLGLVAGALVGVIFPATLVGTVVWAGSGTAFGGIVGHLARGMSRGELKDLGEELDSGEAALVLIAKDKLDDDLDKVLTKATKRIEKVLAVDQRELQAEIDQAFSEATAGR